MTNNRFYEHRRFSKKKTKDKSKNDNSYNSYQKEYSLNNLLSDIGNQEIANLFESGLIQAKLNVSQPGDMYEQEADRIAKNIVNTNTVQTPKVSSVQAKTGVNKLTVNGGAESKIKGLKGKGNPLHKSIKDYFEPRFGVDLGNVKVHTGSNPNQLAKSINARAFTYGNDIVFGQGQYQPSTTEGKQLIAHELVHTQQQGNALQRNIVQREETSNSNTINNIRIFSNSNNLRVSIDLSNDYQSPKKPSPIYSNDRNANTHAIILNQTILNSIIKGMESKIIEINSGGITTIEFSEHNDDSTWIVIVSNENVSCTSTGHGSTGNIIFFDFQLDTSTTINKIDFEIATTPTTTTQTSQTTTSQTTTSQTTTNIPSNINPDNYGSYTVKNIAEWFVLHQFTSYQASVEALENYQDDDDHTGVVHGLVDNDGSWYQVTPFNQDALGTKSDSYTSKAKAELAGKLLHIEMNYNADSSPDDELYNKVAEIYAYIYYANNKKLKIICHREVDRGITSPSARNDPFNFDFNKLYKILKDTYNITITPGVDGITQERYEYENWPEHRPHYETDNFFPLSGKPELDPDY